MSSGHVFVVTRVASDSTKRGFLLFGVGELSELCELCEPSERMKSRVWNPSGAMSLIMHRRKYFRWPWSTVEIMNMKRGMNDMRFMIFSIMKFGRCWGMRWFMRLYKMKCVKRVGHGWMAMDWWVVRFKMVISITLTLYLI